MDIKYTNYNKCLTNVANSILKYYDLKTYHSTLKELDDILEEKKYKNIILMLYDGMGSNILKRNLSSNSFLNKNKLMNIDAVFPATTTASTTSVLSGKNPNEHGWLGWDLYFKEFDKTISIFPNTIKDTNLLFSEQNVSEIKYQYTNIIKKVATKVNSVGLFPFKETKYIDIDDMHSKILNICNNNKNNFIYAYLEEPDSTMHRNGTDSKITKDLFENLNRKTEVFARKLKDTLLILIADHGHMNATPIFLNQYEDIFNLLEHNISIEARATSFFIKQGKQKDFEKIFNKYFKNDFILYTKEKVIKNRLFGPGKNNIYFEDTIGDFLAVATKDKYFLYNEHGKIFKSVHAGITEDEVVVPLIIYKS